MRGVVLVIIFATLLVTAEAFLPLQARARGTTVFAAPKSKVADKVRVKLLADVKGLGKKSEIVMVSRAQWQNVMAPQKIAQQV
jgi:hypothetical protein